MKKDERFAVWSVAIALLFLCYFGVSSAIITGFPDAERDAIGWLVTGTAMFWLSITFLTWIIFEGREE